MTDKNKSDTQITVKESSFFSRYREIFIAIILFIIVDLGVLTLNFFTAIQLSKDAVGINLAGRQRMLSQRITKSLLSIDSLTKQGQPIQNAIKELTLSYELFDNTLKAFDMGGFTTGATGNQVTLEAAQEIKARQAIITGKALWEPLRELLKPVLLSQDKVNLDVLQKAIDYAKTNNLALLKEMNNLTVALEQEANSRTAFLRLIQTLAIIFLIGNYAFIIYDFFTKIRRSDQRVEQKNRDLEEVVESLKETTFQLESSQKETNTILETVRQGLLLINSEFKISDKHSHELNEMFHIDDLAGANFLNIMQRLLTQKDYYTCRDYCEMLFDPRKKEKTLLKINPLDEAEVHFQEKSGIFTTKHFEFQFKRVLIEKEITNVFISVRDISTQVRLANELKESELRKEVQFNLLLSLLNVDPADIKAFCEQTSKSLLASNSVLKIEDFIEESATPQPDDSLRKKLDTVFRHIHSIKGHASSLSIDYFVEMTHGFEDTIEKLRSKPKLAGEDFLAIAALLSEGKSAIEECQGLAERMSLQAPALIPFSSTQETTISSECPLKSEILSEMVVDLSQKTAKEATIFFEIESDLNLDRQQSTILHQAAIQLIRNSFAHGIEQREDRLDLGKESEARIVIGLNQQEDKKLNFFYTDDGAGLNISKIRARALEKEMISEEEASKVANDNQWWPYIFEPGFSTSEEPDKMSGRGVGLDIIRHSIMEDLQGQIFLYSEPKKFFRFDAEIPALT
ncbi:MAG: type IV pili methyl-accepting chemotaxis transducer N-terminal domain-containing protein [Verrucomicrobiota bacterium]